LMEKQMKQKETNEVMAFKLHIIYSTLKGCFKFLSDCKTDTVKTDKEKLILFAKTLLATKDDNFPKTLELFLRQAIKEFPYHHSVLFQQMVRTLSSTEIGQEPSAASVINQALIGQRMASDETFCTACGTSPAKKRCGSCRMVNYCSPECQKLHWFAHKRWCPDLAKEYEQFLIAKQKLAEQEKQQQHQSENQPQPIETESSTVPLEPLIDETPADASKKELEIIPGTS